MHVNYVYYCCDIINCVCVWVYGLILFQDFKLENDARQIVLTLTAIKKEIKSWSNFPKQQHHKDINNTKKFYQCHAKTLGSKS